MTVQKRRRFYRTLLSYSSSFLLIFALIAFVVTCSIMLFFQGVDMTEQQIRLIAPPVFWNVLLLTSIIFTADLVRRKLTVDKASREIDEVLLQISGGDFSARIDTARIAGRYEALAGIADSINRLAQELGGVETLRTDFIANVSHELKTPLAVIQHYGTLLQQTDLTEDKRLEYAKCAAQASRRLANLIANMLKLNKLENQQIFPSAKEYDLGEQLCECLLQFETVWETKGIDIETAIAEDVRICADAELLSLVWNNLLSNAFKFTESGGRVTISLTADEREVTVTVCDTGCGIPPEVGTHIFDKFYQGDTSHAAEGNGLGLALVKRVVDILHGEIRVESIPEQGSTFIVKFRRT